MKLEKYTFLNDIEKEAKIFLEKRLKPISVKKNTILFYQGEVCSDILWLSSGTVRLYMQAEAINHITLYTLNPGEQCIVNTVSLLTQTDAIASAETLTDIEGYIIDKESINELSRISHVYQHYLLTLYNLRFNEFAQLINDIKFKRLDQRILDWLKIQPIQMIKVTHEMLAVHLGSSRVVISRLLKDMENNGILQLHRGSIEIL